MNYIHMMDGQRVKANMGEPKVSNVQGTAVHDQLEVRLQNYQAITVQSL